MEDSEKIWVVDEIPLDRAGLHLGCDPDVATGRWYALYVRSRHEKVVESGLRGKGYPAFSPFYRTKRRRIDRIVEIDVPLFPGYVFCHFDSDKRLPILTTPGLVGVVGPGIGRSQWRITRLLPSEPLRCLDVRFNRGLF